MSTHINTGVIPLTQENECNRTELPRAIAPKPDYMECRINMACDFELANAIRRAVVDSGCGSLSAWLRMAAKAALKGTKYLNDNPYGGGNNEVGE